MTYRLTISMPESIIHYMHHKVKKDGYGTVSEYIRELIRLDQRIEFARAENERMRQNGLPEAASADEIFEYDV